MTEARPVQSLVAIGYNFSLRGLRQYDGHKEIVQIAYLTACALNGTLPREVPPTPFMAVNPRVADQAMLLQRLRELAKSRKTKLLVLNSTELLRWLPDMLADPRIVRRYGVTHPLDRFQPEAVTDLSAGNTNDFWSRKVCDPLDPANNIWRHRRQAPLQLRWSSTLGPQTRRVVAG